MGGFSGLYNMVIFKNLFLAKAPRNAQPIFLAGRKRTTKFFEFCGARKAGAARWTPASF
jgi:hypothetical protein